MKYIKILAVLSTLLAPSISQATTASFSHYNDVKGFYVGAGIGSTGLDDEDDLFAGFDQTEDGNTYKLIAGYQVNRVLAFEAQYTKYGDINFDLSKELQALAPSAPKKLSWAPEALSLTANAGYTFNNGLRPFGLFGLSMLDLNESTKELNEDSYLGLRYGFGLEYTPPAFSALSVRLAYEADFFYAERKETRHGMYSDYTITKLYDFTLDSVYLSASYKF